MDDPDGGSEDYLSMTRAILSAAVDGCIICNQNYEIMIFNNAAEDMFSYKRADVTGLKLGTLFTEKDASVIQHFSSNMRRSTQSSESFEGTAMRRNGTTFPAKISLSMSYFMKKPLVACFVKDYSMEKKQNALITEEKQKSEDLLLNILPLPIANRLKMGEKNICEKFNDVTVFFSDSKLLIDDLDWKNWNSVSNLM